MTPGTWTIEKIAFELERLEPPSPSVGWFCTYTPEEVLIAFGLCPVRIFGTGEHVREADAYLPTNLCPYVRSCLDGFLQGRYDSLAGVVMTTSCNAMCHLHSVWGGPLRQGPGGEGRDGTFFAHILDVPRILSEPAVEYYKFQVRRFIARCREFFAFSPPEDIAIPQDITIPPTISSPLESTARGGMRPCREGAHVGRLASSEDENPSCQGGAIFGIDAHAGGPAPSEDENTFGRGRSIFGIDDREKLRLWDAIRLCEETRALLHELYELRKLPNPPITGREALKIVKMAMSHDKRAFNQVMRQVVEAMRLGAVQEATAGAGTFRGKNLSIGGVREAPLGSPCNGKIAPCNEEIGMGVSTTATGTSTGAVRGKGRPRILVAGSLCPDAVIELIEDAGGLVVMDDLCAGLRYFWDGPTGEGEFPWKAGFTGGGAEQPGFGGGLDFDGDPVEYLARRYLWKPPCARMRDSAKRFELIWRLAGEFKIDGVVFYALKFCDPYLYDAPLLKSYLEKQHIPMLLLEGDYTAGSAGQLRTRIEAFLEML